MSHVKQKSSKLIIIVSLLAKRAHIWIDVRVCVFPSAQLRMQPAAERGGHYQGGGGVGGKEAVRMGTTEAGSGWALPRRAGWVLPKWGEWVLPRRSVVNNSSVTCPVARLPAVTETVMRCE